MIVKQTPVFACETRGTIEVYAGLNEGPGAADWYWRVKSKNSQTLAQGEGYARRDRCLSTVDTLFGSRLTEAGAGVVGDVVIPWRLVVEKRDGTVEWIGQIQ